MRFNGHLRYTVIDSNKPSPTITGNGDKKGGVVVLHHPNNHRIMTLRETAAVQSFPVGFGFLGAKTADYSQLANAVPPLFGKALGHMLLKATITDSKINNEVAFA